MTVAAISRPIESSLFGATNEPINETLLSQLQPIAEVARLGSRTLPELGRQASLYQVTMPDGQFLVERSVAPASSGQQELVFLPGLTEHIQQGYSQSFHDQVSQQFPRADVTTIGSNGIGVKGRDTASRAQRNQQRFSLLQAIAQDKPITVVGTSMGSQIASDVALLNLAAGSPLRMAGQVYFSSALVAGCRTPQTMVRDFVPRLAYDVMRDFGRQPLVNWPHRLGALAAWGARAVAETPSEVNHLLQLLGGTEIAALDTIADSGTKILVVNGLKDSVCEEKAMRGLAERHDNVRFVGIVGHGHELSFSFDKPARKVGREMAAFGLLTASL